MYFYDWTYILVVIGMVICLIAQARVKSTYARYARVGSASGLTGSQAASQILYNSGLHEVRIEHIAGQLTDNYDPRTKILHLSDSTYNSSSVAAIGVAAHECGHAIQHDENYAPLAMRSFLVPVAQFGQTIAWPLILIGLLFSSKSSSIFLLAGIIAFTAAVVLQLITLPVEFNASHRALTILSDSRMLSEQEMKGTRSVLHAAALTYVAAAAASILSLLRIILLSNSRSR